MKLFILTAFVVLLMVLTGCSVWQEDINGITQNSYQVEGTQASQEDYGQEYEYIHVITDRLFATQIMEIKFDTGSFLGRTIRYEGMFSSRPWEGELIYIVAREGESCCGPGGFLGFEVYLNDINSVPEYTWVEVTGILEEIYEAGFGYFLRINAVSMNEVDEPRL